MPSKMEQLRLANRKLLEQAREMQAKDPTLPRLLAGGPPMPPEWAAFFAKMDAPKLEDISWLAQQDVMEPSTHPTDVSGFTKCPN